ncbi:hypothetical protein F4775DRAFT_538138 [Biscogniauxia sp. FL1348]|nr:hypothetical protein F4775DRAFT_538138 [Biscogniauxia sp. FL1348]
MTWITSILILLLPIYLLSLLSPPPSLPKHPQLARACPASKLYNSAVGWMAIVTDGSLSSCLPSPPGYNPCSSFSPWSIARSTKGVPRESTSDLSIDQSDKL